MNGRTENNSRIFGRWFGRVNENIVFRRSLLFGRLLYRPSRYRPTIPTKWLLPLFRVVHPPPSCYVRTLPHLRRGSRLCRSPRSTFSIVSRSTSDIALFIRSTLDSYENFTSRRIYARKETFQIGRNSPSPFYHRVSKLPRDFLSLSLSLSHRCFLLVDRSMLLFRSTNSNRFSLSRCHIFDPNRAYLPSLRPSFPSCYRGYLLSFPRRCPTSKIWLLVIYIVPEISCRRTKDFIASRRFHWCGVSNRQWRDLYVVQK